MYKTITREQLKKIIEEDKNVRIVDVLSREHYAKEHIRGAVSIPLEDLRRDAFKFLKRNERIIVYCASFSCQASTKAAKILVSLGFSDVSDYKGGIADYKEDKTLALEEGAYSSPGFSHGCCGCY